MRINILYNCVADAAYNMPISHEQKAGFRNKAANQAIHARDIGGFYGFSFVSMFSACSAAIAARSVKLSPESSNRTDSICSPLCAK